MKWVLSGFADEAGDRVDDQIAALVESGMDHIDLRSVDGVNIAQLPVDHAERVRVKLDAAGIRVCMFGSPIGKIDIADDIAIDLDRLRHLARMRDVFASNWVRIFSYYNRGGASERVWQAEAIERLRRLVELADSLGLVLYLENEIGIFGSDCRRVSILRDTVRRAAPQTFRLIFDFDNFNQNGDDVWAAWTALRDDIGAIHLKESRRQEDGTFQHVPAGQGDGQIPRVLRDLADRQWDGPLILEPHLARSTAVLATGPHGQANAALSDMTPRECFVLAAEAARKLIADVGRL